MNIHKFSKFFFPLAILLGLVSGFSGIPWIFTIAEHISTIFINLLKLISLPLIFFSIVSTISGMQGIEELKHLGQKVLKYTLITTLLAAFIALGFFLLIDPAKVFLSFGVPHFKGVDIAPKQGYLHYLSQVIPSNIIQPFSEGNVIGVLILAVFLSVAIVALPKDKRLVLHSFFSSFYAAIMKVTTFIIQPMPIAIWAFVALFVRELQHGLSLEHLALYLVCIVSANLLHGLVVLPLLLKIKKISVTHTFLEYCPLFPWLFGRNLQCQSSHCYSMC